MIRVTIKPVDNTTGARFEKRNINRVAIKSRPAILPPFEITPPARAACKGNEERKQAKKKREETAGIHKANNSSLWIGEGDRIKKKRNV